MTTEAQLGSGRSAEQEETPTLGLLRIALVVALPFAGGYFLSYLFRSVNAVISGRLLSELGLDASALGLLTAAYFLAFACFQLPLGLLLDRFGPRRVQAGLLLFAAIGGVVFALGESLTTLMIGRALIGLGCAGGLMASLKALSLWFPPQRWALVNGCFLMVGGLGAATATAPVEAALHLVDWRTLFLILSGATLLVASLIFLVVPPRGEQGAAQSSLREQIAGLGRILSSRLFWAAVPLSVTTLAAGLSLQGLWAGPWLSDVGGLSSSAVAGVLLALALSMTVGFFFGGLLADGMERIGLGLDAAMVLGAILFILPQLAIVLELAPQSALPWMAFGFTSNLCMVIYPRLARSFPLSLSGRVNTSLNLMVFTGAFAMQYAIGGLLDLAAPEAQGRYPAEAYQLAFGGVVGLQLLSLLWYLVFLPRGQRI
ncbi:MFS transporter [Aquibaculum sediminis]|uniref:MFS transporter n=1 Tax=Aquibaculum sediminis TaxID=3231907 RepID=UPI003456AD9A